MKFNHKYTGEIIDTEDPVVLPVIQPEVKPKVEVPPVIPAPEDQSKQEKNVPEADGKDLFDHVSEKMSGVRRSISEKVESVRDFLSEGIYKVPGLNKIVGKLEIAYNQVGINANEQSSVDLKGKVEALSARVQSLEDSKQSLISVAEKLKSNGMPGSEKILLKLQGLDKEKNDLLGKKDTMHSAFEAKQNRIKEYTSSRDAVAGKLIEYYDKKIEPFNKEIDSLRTNKEHLGFSTTVMEVRHQQKMEQVTKLETDRAEIEKNLKLAGINEKEIKSLTKEITDAINTGRIEVKKEKEKIDKEMKNVDASIARKREQANPYHDAREEFVRVTHVRPQDIRMPQRKMGEVYEPKKEIVSEIVSENVETGQGEQLPAGGFMAERSVERRDRTPIGGAIELWNQVLKEKNEKAIPSIDPKELFMLTKGLNKDLAVNLSEFKKIIEAYYKIKKVDARTFETYYRNAFSKLL